MYPCFPGSSPIPPGRSREPGTGISAPDCPNAILVRWSRTNQELCLDICSRDFSSSGWAPGRCFGAEEEGRTFSGHGEVTARGTSAGISRKLNKQRRVLRTAQRCRGGQIMRQISAGSSPGRVGMEGPSRSLQRFAGAGAERGRRAPRPFGSIPVYPAGVYLFIFKLLFNFVEFISACAQAWSATGTPVHRGLRSPPAGTPSSSTCRGSRFARAHGGCSGSPPSREPSPPLGHRAGSAESGPTAGSPGQGLRGRSHRRSGTRRGLGGSGAQGWSSPAEPGPGGRLGTERLYACTRRGSAGAAKETREEEGSIVRSEQNFTESLRQRMF